MNNLVKKVRGATLLEVMLVLAIAAMIIVMSVRYYQTATSNQQANAVISQIQAIVVAADQLAQATGSYAGATDTAIAPLVPANGQTTPWGTPIAVTGGGAAGYTIGMDAPAGVCPLVVTKILTNNHFTTSSTCNASGSSTLSFVYASNPA